MYEYIYSHVTKGDTELEKLSMPYKKLSAYFCVHVVDCFQIEQLYHSRAYTRMVQMEASIYEFKSNHKNFKRYNGF